MSKCISCKYALYDGMCVAQGKYTALDAKSCDLYEPSISSRIAKLEHDNARLRELARRMWPFAKSYLGMLPALGINDTESYDIYLEMRKLGVEEDE